MNEMPELLTLSMSAARHAATRQKVIAANVANADTPGYLARDVAPFSPEMGEMPLRRTHIGHFAGTARTAQIFEESGTPADPNGNTVSLEDQILRGIEAQRHHNRAVSVYQSALDLMRSSLGRR